VPERKPRFTNRDPSIERFEKERLEVLEAKYVALRNEKYLDDEHSLPCGSFSSIKDDLSMQGVEEYLKIPFEAKEEDPLKIPLELKEEIVINVNEIKPKLQESQHSQEVT
jgi:hypothetical protein